MCAVIRKQYYESPLSVTDSFSLCLLVCKYTLLISYMSGHHVVQTSSSYRAQADPYCEIEYKIEVKQN